MYRNSLIKIAMCLSFLSVMVLLGNLTPNAFAAKIAYKNQKLSLEAHNEELGQILKQLNKKTGVIFHYGSQTAKTKITVRFQKLPLVKALARLLNNQNYILVMDENQKPKNLHILAPAGKSANSETNDNLGQGVGDGNYQNPYQEENKPPYQDPNQNLQDQSQSPDPFAQEQAENENQETEPGEEQMEKRQPRYPGAPGNPVDQFKQQ